MDTFFRFLGFARDFLRIENDVIALRGCNITHRYRYHKVLQDVSLELRTGDCFALLGANGVGKTTLIRIFATLLVPTSGVLEIMGKDSRADRAKARRDLFFIGHGTFLYEDLTVIENIEFALGLRGALPAPNEIQKALDRVGIGPFASQKSRYLSAGLQKRLALAKAILVRPAILLLDEPYAALDENGRDVMNDCIRGFLAEGAAVLMSSHDRATALSVAPRVGILQNKALQEVSPASLGTTDLC